MTLCTTLLLSTDDLLALLREFVNSALSRAGLGRCLRRHGVSHLRKLACLLKLAHLKYPQAAIEPP